MVQLMTLVVFTMVLLGCIAVAVPVPWFPEDPYQDLLDHFAGQKSLAREEILDSFGEPWVAIGNKTFVYISDKPSSKVLWAWGVASPGGASVGESGIGDMTHRDFVLVFDFDEDGLMVQLDSYKDSGDHEHCFVNGICFEAQSENTPLAPPMFDSESKEFRPTPGLCTVYLYRDDITHGKTYWGYVDIKLGELRGRQSHAVSAAASVGEGFFRWQVLPGRKYQLIANFEDVNSFPFTVHTGHEERAETRLDFICGEGRIIYFRLAIPKRETRKPELHMMETIAAQTQIKQRHLLMGRYRPELTMPD